MNEHIVVPSNIPEADLVALLQVCQLEPQNERPKGLGYPGITLKDDSFIIPTVREIADRAVQEAGWSLDYHWSTLAGSGVNFLHYSMGDRLGPHVDKPLHGDDLVHTADSEVKLTVVMNLSSDCDGGKFAFIDSESGHREMVDLPVGHALVYQASESYTQVTEVTSGELFQLAAFFIA